MSLLTLATLKEFLRISHTAEDTALQLILDAAEAWIAQRANIHLCAGDEYDEFTERHDGGSLYIWPENLPIREITSIVDKCDDDTAVPATEFFNTDSRIERWDDEEEDGEVTTWDEGRRRYEITYEAGYTSDNLPASFKRAVMHLCYRDYHGRLGGEGGLYDPERDAALLQMLEPFSLRRPMS